MVGEACQEAHQEGPGGSSLGRLDVGAGQAPGEENHVDSGRGLLYFEIFRNLEDPFRPAWLLL